MTRLLLEYGRVYPTGPLPSLPGMPSDRVGEQRRVSGVILSLPRRGCIPQPGVRRAASNARSPTTRRDSRTPTGFDHAPCGETRDRTPLGFGLPWHSAANRGALGDPRL